MQRDLRSPFSEITNQTSLGVHTGTRPSDLERIAELIGNIRGKKRAEYETGDYFNWDSEEGSPHNSLAGRELHLVICDVLRETQHGLTLAEIQKRIAAEKQYVTRNGKDVSYQQVYVTVRNHEELFEINRFVRPAVVNLRRTQHGDQPKPQTVADTKRHPKPTSTSSDQVWFTEISDRVWFAVAHWAKVNNYLAGWERGLLYTLGWLARKRLTPSEKQAFHGRRLLTEAIELGFSMEEDL